MFEDVENETKENIPKINFGARQKRIKTLLLTAE